MSGPVCTANDRQRWRRLINEARACARKPSRAWDGLRRAADKAERAVFPDQAPERRGQFVKLLGFARAWQAMGEASRADSAAAVLELAEACAVQLGQVPAEPPVPTEILPYRADIDG